MATVCPAVVGTVVTGTLVSGRIENGQTLEVLPGERTVRLEWSYRRSPSDVLPGYPQTARADRVEREGVVRRYKRYYKDVKIKIRPGATYEAVWLPVEGQEERVPGIRVAKR